MKERIKGMNKAREILGDMLTLKIVREPEEREEIIGLYAAYKAVTETLIEAIEAYAPEQAEDCAEARRRLSEMEAAACGI